MAGHKRRIPWEVTDAGRQALADTMPGAHFGRSGLRALADEMRGAHVWHMSTILDGERVTITRELISRQKNDGPTDARVRCPNCLGSGSLAVTCCSVCNGYGSVLPGIP